MKKLTVQSNTPDEWEIAYTLGGVKTAKNLVVMLHGGGMDHHEKGMYPGLDNGRPAKNESGKTKLYEMHIGNYDRLEVELLSSFEEDVMSLRIDLRNHGESLVNGNMDKRDTLVRRDTYDVSDVIDEVVKTHPSIEHIYLVGTCFGGLIAESYATSLFKDEQHQTKNANLVSSLALNCPLSFTSLYTTDVDDGFNYKKCQMLISGEEGIQFTKMPGMFEGKETMNESKNIGDISELIGELKIPTLYIYGADDRIISRKKSEEIAANIALINDQTIIKKIDSTNHGFSDHCLFDPQSSDAYLMEITEFLNNNIEQNKKTL